MITVHHLANSRSQRVLWLLEELGLPYEVLRYERDAKTMLAPAALRDVHPLGKSPVISEGETVVAESGAIMEYLVEVPGLGRLKPATGSADLLQWRYWMHFAEGSAMTPLIVALIMSRVANAPLPWLAKPIVGPIAKGIAAQVMKNYVMPNVSDQLDFIESHLSAQPWFAGAEFSAADIQMSFPLEAVMSRGLVGQRPRIVAFLKAIHARPAYARALEAGGPYDYNKD